MCDFKSLADKSWALGHVLFAMTKSWRIRLSALRSLGLIAFQLITEQGKIGSSKYASILSLK